MTNSSATGGFLSLSPTPDYKDIEDVLHDLVVGITGIADDLVRPAYQVDPPRHPEAQINWCAFTISVRTADNVPEIIHHAEEDGHDEIIDYEDLHVLVSFYGPTAADKAKALRTGLYVPQNRATLRPNNLAFIKAENIIPMPGYAFAGWLTRWDLPLVFKHKISRTYAVKNLVKSTGSIETESTATISEGLIVTIGCNK